MCHTCGAARKRCTFDGCTNIVVKGGVCVTHGAKVERKRCSFKDCTSYAQKGGVCKKHGAKVEVKTAKHCSHDGCTNGAVRGGVCITHGSKVERKHCSFEGCASFAQKGGVCKRHGSTTIINTDNTNSPTIEQKVEVTLAIPLRESINHEEEEELISWICKSSRIPSRFASNAMTPSPLSLSAQSEYNQGEMDNEDTFHTNEMRQSVEI